ncbi:MAG TPA: proton-conducting transporter membrane subunit [Caldilineaceae bacterium]|nr:proton-conducting transporter membrane subunit [Caldilineaceae bacterium]
MTLHVNWLSLPIVIPLLAAALGLPFIRWGLQRAARWQYRLALLGMVANLAVALVLLAYTVGGNRLVLQMGLWPAPFGITVMADGLTAIMLTLTAILALATVLYAGGTLDARVRLNYYPLTCFLIMGVNGAFLAGDIFNLYVFFEVLLMASFALLTLGGQIGQINGGIRYVVLNLLASTIFLASAGLVYGTLGTLNMAHMAERMPLAPRSVQLLIGGLLLIAYSTKAGLFPLFFWLPASYHTPHPSVTALFGGLLTKVGIYTLFRLYPLVFPQLLQEWQVLILGIAGMTMLVGVFGAMAVNTMRRVLSFHIISQVGYMVMGLGLAASADPAAAVFGMAAGIYYLVHHMIVKTALLMAGGAAEIEAATGSLLRARLAGLSHIRPALGIIFFLAAMSLAGIPPSSGFISKLALLQGAIGSSHWTIAAVSLVVSLFTLISMVRLWQTAFWNKPQLADDSERLLDTRLRRGLTLAPIGLLVALSLTIGLFSGPFFRWSTIAAEQVMDRTGYIEAVAPTDVIEYAGASHAQP